MRESVDNFEAGIVYDDINFNLPDGVFTEGRNIRVRAASLEKVKGNQPVLGSLSVTPIWAESITDGTNAFWAYASTDKIYGTDGSTHAQINSISFAASVDLGWTGGKYHGYLVLNDAVNPPQTWVPALANKVQPLANWPGSTFCKVIRSFGDFLVALRITQGGTYNPRLLRWSDAGAFAALPGSWDYTDPTNQAGITELGQTDDALVDCLPLRDVNVIYKQFNTWLMQPVGQPDVFAFRQLFNQSGLLSENCAAAFGSQHFVLTDSDIMVHDGSQAQSVGQHHRKWLFNNMSTSFYARSFVVANYREREMWTCFPENGNSFPNLALVWQWSENKFHVRELGTRMVHGANGIVSGTNATFDGLSGTFDAQVGAFDDPTFSPFAQRMVLWRGEGMQALQSDTGEKFDTTTMTSYVERSNMALTKDVGSIKRVKRIFPKVYGTAGDVLSVYVGARATPDAALAYSGPFQFTIGSSYKIDCRVSGRFIAVKFSGALTNTFRISGFDVEFDNDGNR